MNLVFHLYFLDLFTKVFQYFKVTNYINFSYEIIIFINVTGFPPSRIASSLRNHKNRGIYQF